MTFNILEGGKNGLDRIFEVIEEQDPDLVLVQETSTLNNDFATFATSAGYAYVQNDLTLDRFEVALLSKYPILDSEPFLRMLSATIEVEGVPIRVFNGHLAPGGLNAERIYQMRHLVWDHLRTDREVYPIIVGGDFNAWSNQTEILGELTDLGFSRDGHNNHLDYIYSFGLEYVPNSERVLGVTGGSSTWPSDHKAIVVEYALPSVKQQETTSFTVKNAAFSSYTFTPDDFSSHFPKGGLEDVEFLTSGTKGQLLLNGQPIGDGTRIAAADLNNLVYENHSIGRDMVEWKGYAPDGPASTSSFLYVENTGVIGDFDRANLLYDVAILDANADLYFGNGDYFVSTSEPSLLGAEFVKFPTYALLYTFLGHPEHYANFFSLTLDTAADMYVAFDERFVQPPDWLVQHYERTDISFSSNRHNYVVYKQQADSGSLTFGQNNWSYDRRFEQSHLIFLAVPRNTALEVALTEPAHEAFDVEPSLTLSWSTAAAATEYEIEVAADAQFSNILARQTSSSATLGLQDLAFGRLYFWRVRARSATATGAWSPTYAFTTRLPNDAPSRRSADLRGQGIIFIEDATPLTTVANPTAYQVTGQSLTVEAWAKFAALPPHREQSTLIVRPYDGEPYEAYHLRVGNFDDVNNPVFESLISDGTPNWGYARWNVPVDEWVHIAMAYDGATVNLYIDGVLVQSNPYTRSVGSGVRGLYLGGRFDWDNFTGWLDEVRLWDRARTQEEISATRYARLRGDEPSLLGYWSLDEVVTLDGVRATPDATPNNNHLRLGSVELVDATPLDSRPNSVSTQTAELPDEAMTLALYPNPSPGSTQLHITLQRSEELSIRLFDIMGRQVMAPSRYVLAEGTHAISVDLSTLANGLYFAHVTSTHDVQTKAVIVAR